MNPILEYELAKLLADQPCVTEDEARRELGILVPTHPDYDEPADRSRRREPAMA